MRQHLTSLALAPHSFVLSAQILPAHRKIHFKFQKSPKVSIRALLLHIFSYFPFPHFLFYFTFMYSTSMFSLSLCAFCVQSPAASSFAVNSKVLQHLSFLNFSISFDIFQCHNSFNICSIALVH